MRDFVDWVELRRFGGSMGAIFMPIAELDIPT